MVGHIPYDFQVALARVHCYGKCIILSDWCNYPYDETNNTISHIAKNIHDDPVSSSDKADAYRSIFLFLVVDWQATDLPIPYTVGLEPPEVGWDCGCSRDS